MDKAQAKEVATVALKGALFSAAIRVAQQVFNGVKVGNEKVVLFTAKR